MNKELKSHYVEEVKYQTKAKVFNHFFLIIPYVHFIWTYMSHNKNRRYCWYGALCNHICDYWAWN